MCDDIEKVETEVISSSSVTFGARCGRSADTSNYNHHEVNRYTILPYYARNDDYQPCHACAASDQASVSKSDAQ